MYVKHIHSSKSECIEYITNYLVETLTPFLPNSELSLTKNDSRRTNSKYLNLCFPSGEQNPFSGKFPFVVRISDHKGASLFHPSQPNYQILIEPFFTSKEDFELYKSLVKKHKDCSKQFLIGNQDHNNTLNSLNWISNQIEDLKNHVMYQFNEDLLKICSDMIEILEANPKKEVHNGN